MTPVLSIILPVYNHEKYMEKALSSIENQEIDFEYEVIIGEDFSTDSSRAILKKYESEAPENYSFFYREKNWGMRENISDLINRATGEFLIVLEADDYWIDSKKIKSQVEFLINHTEYSGCAHKVVVVDEQGTETGEEYPDTPQGEVYTLRNYLEGQIPGQTASFMYRNYFRGNNLFRYLECDSTYPLDRFIAFAVASYGDIYCGSEYWSAYRFVTKEGSSYSANHDATTRAFARNAFLYHKSLYRYSLSEKRGRLSVQVSEKLYYKSFLREWKQDGKGLRSLLKEVSRMKNPVGTTFWIFQQYIILRKEASLG